jgi:hypothetical protein
MEKLKFDRKCVCDFCGNEEICAITHYGTSIYNRLVCVECAMSINENDRIYRNNNEVYFDLNNSIIRFNFDDENEIGDESYE